MIKSRITLSDICGAGFVFHPRRSPLASRWASSGVAGDELSTGNQVMMMGNMPMICSRGVANPESIAFLASLGLKIESPLLTYSSEKERLSHISEACEKGFSIITTHRLPANELASECSWVKPELLSALNNKGELARYVPDEVVPEREVAVPAALLEDAALLRLPCAVKAASDETSAAGLSVAICRTRAELISAYSLLESCSRVVLEAFCHFEKNYCLNFSITRYGAIEYLGAAEQIIINGCRYSGNWLGKLISAPVEAIEAARKVVEAGRDAGYFGIVGLDLGILQGGTVIIYDLNFRVTGCTMPLLLFDAMSSQSSWSMAQYTTLQAGTEFNRFLTLLDRCSRKGYLLPFSILDPAHVNDSASRPSASVLIFGDSKAQIDEHRVELKALGFE